MMSGKTGRLYLVATPIGNLEDLSPRAAAVLAQADWVVAEDTRHTLRLLNHLGLRKHLESYHAHNRRQKEVLLLDKLRQGGQLALVTDAGMPGISDPGADLVAACVAQDIPVTVIPGPCAAVTALAGSGLETDRFVFEGFLPPFGKDRRQRLQQLSGEMRTSILYEAPHRLSKTLSDLAEIGLADRRLTVARELTKRFEEFRYGTVGGAIRDLAEQEIRGEFVLVLEGLSAYAGRCPETDSTEQPEQPIIDRLQVLLESGLSVKSAVRQCADETGLTRNELYKLALQAQSARSDGDQP
jgi:16S rRNA (cytidine1402-2'-O)-methyltransferase